MGQPVSDLPADVCDAVVARLEEAPVSLALLFGSHATGEASGGSDVDFAVEYDDVDSVADVHLGLAADLAQILGRDDIDVVRLSTVDPRVAVEALEHGCLLVGRPEAARQLRERLEPARRRREAVVKRRIEETERKIERRIRNREHGL